MDRINELLSLFYVGNDGGLLSEFASKRSGFWIDDAIDWPELAYGIETRASQLLPELLQTGQIRDADSPDFCVAMLWACVFVIERTHKLHNPSIPKGTRAELRRHIRNIRQAASFLGTLGGRSLTLHSNVAWGALRLRHHGVFSEHNWAWLAELCFVGYPVQHALAFAIVSALASEQKINDNEAWDRKIAPKRDFASSCISLIQRFGDIEISTSPNSPFLDFVSLAYELAMGEQGASLEGPARKAWREIRAEGGLHIAARAHFNLPPDERALARFKEAETYVETPEDRAPRLANWRRLLDSTELDFTENEIAVIAALGDLFAIKERSNEEQEFYEQLCKRAGIDPL